MCRFHLYTGAPLSLDAIRTLCLCTMSTSPSEEGNGVDGRLMSGVQLARCTSSAGSYLSRTLIARWIACWSFIISTFIFITPVYIYTRPEKSPSPDGLFVQNGNSASAQFGCTSRARGSVGMPDSMDGVRYYPVGSCSGTEAGSDLGLFRSSRLTSQEPSPFRPRPSCSGSGALRI